MSVAQNIVQCKYFFLWHSGKEALNILQLQFFFEIHVQCDTSQRLARALKTGSKQTKERQCVYYVH